MPFDPEESARETGHAHEIPPNVTPLTDAERKALVEASARKVASYGRPAPEPDTDLDTETDPIVLSRAITELGETLRRFFTTVSRPDSQQRLMLWEELTFLHAIAAKIELVVLGMDVAAAKEQRTERRRNIPGGYQL